MKDGIAIDMLSGSEANDSTSEDSSSSDTEDDEKGNLRNIIKSVLF